MELHQIRSGVRADRLEQLRLVVDEHQRAVLTGPSSEIPVHRCLPGKIAWATTLGANGPGVQDLSPARALVAGYRSRGLRLAARGAASIADLHDSRSGDLTAAALMIDEARSIAEATGDPPLVNAPMILASWRGHEGEALELIEATSREAVSRRWTSNNYARSVLYNGLGRHEDARATAWQAFQPDPIG